MAIDTEERTSETPASQNGTPGQPVKSNKKVIMIVLIVVGALVVLGIVGSIVSGFLIKKGAESLFSAATGGAVEIDTKNGGEVKIKTEDGEVTSGSVKKVPDDFPGSVPIYKTGAKLTNVMTFKDSKTGKTFILSYELKDSPEKVHEFYEKELSTNGWEISTSASSNFGITVVARNEAKSLETSVSASGDRDGVTRLTINTSPFKVK